MINLKIGAVVKKKLGLDEDDRGSQRTNRHFGEESRKLQFTNPDDHKRFVKSLYNAVKK